MSQRLERYVALCSSLSLTTSSVNNNMRRTADTKRLKSKPAAEAGIFPVAEAPRIRRPYAFGDGSVGVEGRIYTPDGDFSQVLPATGAAGQGSGSSVGHVILDNAAEEPDEVDIDREARDEKKRRQWRKWSEDIIPALLRPYLQLLRETSGLRVMDSVRRKGCRGCDGVRQLTVSCIFFESRFLISIVCFDNSN